MTDDNYLTKANWLHRNTKRAYCIVGFSTHEDDHCLLVTYRLCDTAAAEARGLREAAKRVYEKLQDRAWKSGKLTNDAQAARDIILALITAKEPTDDR